MVYVVVLNKVDMVDMSIVLDCKAYDALILYCNLYRSSKAGGMTHNSGNEIVFDCLANINASKKTWNIVFSAPHDPLANFTPAYRSPAPPTVQHLEWGTINTRVIGIVVRVLSQRKIGIPATTEI
uniref:Uncharacterized protein n=1 Tax=Lactuca sativa TaxID=4236 RepID=A0A9R1WK39_LACSA|nr:hypothetical protein LSAT_V11C100044950 [Lactuca sativa]